MVRVGKSCCGHFTQSFQQRMYKHREDIFFNLLEPDRLSLNFNSRGRRTNFSLFRWRGSLCFWSEWIVRLIPRLPNSVWFLCRWLSCLSVEIRFPIAIRINKESIGWKIGFSLDKHLMPFYTSIVYKLRQRQDKELYFFRFTPTRNTLISDSTLCFSFRAQGRWLK